MGVFPCLNNLDLLSQQRPGPRGAGGNGRYVFLAGIPPLEAFPLTRSFWTDTSRWQMGFARRSLPVLGKRLSPLNDPFHEVTALPHASCGLNAPILAAQCSRVAVRDLRECHPLVPGGVSLIWSLVIFGNVWNDNFLKKSLIQVYMVSVSPEGCYGYVVFTTPNVEPLTPCETQEEPYEKSLSFLTRQPRKLILRQIITFLC